MLYKDAANRKSNQKNLGTIRSSNLCTEIMEYTAADEIAVCNLASISLPMFVENGEFNHQLLYNVTKRVTRNLNKVIDRNYYPVPEAENSNMRHRPVGLGVQGLADAFILLRMPFTSDEAKQLLTGVHLGLDGEGLECAATDGHRLAVLRLQNSADGEADLDVTVPARSLRELERLLSSRGGSDPVSLFCDRGQVVFQWADQVLTSRSLDGIYPNYRQLIPESFARSLKLDRKGLLGALERVAVLADQHNNVVKITSDPVAGQLAISADAQDVGSGSEAIAADVSGDAIQIAFNVRYVLEGLKAMNAERVELRCNAPTTPVVLAPEDESAFTYLVMPVQIRQ